MRTYFGDGGSQFDSQIANEVQTTRFFSPVASDNSSFDLDLGRDDSTLVAWAEPNNHHSD